MPLVFLFLIVNNFLLQKAQDKKASVLEVFFEIPRKTCKNLQKDCERFIQKFASSNEGDVEVQSDIDFDEDAH